VNRVQNDTQEPPIASPVVKDAVFTPAPTLPQSSAGVLSDTDGVSTASHGKRTDFLVVALLVIVGVVIAAVVGLGHHPNKALAKSAPTTQAPATTHLVVGELEVDYPTANEIAAPGQSCSVPLAWGGESAGDQAVMTNGSGTTLDTGTVLGGEVVGPSAKDPNAPGCRLVFNLDRVPNSPYYQVTIDGHRSPLYSEAQMKKMQWTMLLSLVP
jgi:hypothetical protein